MLYLRPFRHDLRQLSERRAGSDARQVPDLLQAGLPGLRPARVRSRLLQPALRSPLLLRRRRRRMSFPYERPRRLRRTERLRAMVRETTLTPAQLIYPLFVAPGEGLRREIASLPGCFHLSVDEVAREAEEVERLGIGGVILFGLPSAKDPVGSEGYADDGVVQRAVRAIRAACRICSSSPTSASASTPPTGTAASSRTARSTTTRPSTCSPGGGVPRAGGRRRRRALGHDGRPGGRDPRGARRGRVRRDCRSCPTPPSTPRPSTARSARRPTRRRSSATGAATRWTRPTCARRCARSRSTSRRARTS